MTTHHAPRSRGSLFIGIDGGGTNCRARLVDAELRCLGEGLAGAANPYQNLEGTRTAILAATGQALTAAGFPLSARADVIVGAGLAGVNVPAVHRAMAQWRHPFSSFHITTDLEIACLGAHAGGDGAVMISGTGSSGCSIVAGQVTVVGAFGYPLADTGSGGWIGLSGLRAALRARERLGPPTSLTEAVEQKLGVSGGAVVEALIDAGNDTFAQFATLVFDAADSGDSIAVAIVQEGASYLGELARRLLENAPPAISLLGGLSGRLTPWLDRDIAERLTVPKRSAMAGACYFARREFTPHDSGDAVRL